MWQKLSLNASMVDLDSEEEELVVDVVEKDKYLPEPWQLKVISPVISLPSPEGPLPFPMSF